MKPNVNEKGKPVKVCIECKNVEVDPGTSPCTPEECEICAITSGTLQYLGNLKVNP